MKRKVEKLTNLERLCIDVGKALVTSVHDSVMTVTVLSMTPVIASVWSGNFLLCFSESQKHSENDSGVMSSSKSLNRAGSPSPLYSIFRCRMGSVRS